MRNFTSRQEEKKWNVELAINLRNTETKKKVSEFNFARFDAMEWQHRRASQSGLSCILHGNPIISIHFPPCSAAELQKKKVSSSELFFFELLSVWNRRLCKKISFSLTNVRFSFSHSLILSISHSASHTMTKASASRGKYTRRAWCRRRWELTEVSFRLKPSIEPVAWSCVSRTTLSVEGKKKRNNTEVDP